MKAARDPYSFAVVLPSYGRKIVLEETIEQLLEELGKYDLIIAVTSRQIDEPQNNSSQIVKLSSERGSTLQRNAALHWLEKSGIAFFGVVFLDDDVVLVPGFFARLRRIHCRFPFAVGFTFRVIADGAGRGGISRLEANDLARTWSEEEYSGQFIPRNDCYGGFSMRGDFLGKVSFDERLVEYGFMEDWDFYAQLRQFGETGHSPSTCLVHLASHIGRADDKCIGYAQIMNPIYFVAKGTLSLKDCLRHIGMAFLSNLLGSTHMRDRQKRLYGNLLAARDVLRFGSCPERVADLK